MKFDNFCDLFDAIEANPKKIVEDFTFRDYLQARYHLQICKKCTEIANRVAANTPKSTTIELSEN